MRLLALLVILTGCGSSRYQSSRDAYQAEAPEDQRDTLADAGPTHEIYLAPGVPADAEDRFNQAPHAVCCTPQVLYPLDGSVHAPNIDSITFRWIGGGATDVLYQLRLEAGGYTSDIYAQCTGDCEYELPGTVWAKFAHEHPDVPVTVTLRGLNASGEATDESKLTVKFAPEDVRGGLYFWSTRMQGIYRLLFGQAKALPYIAPMSQENPTRCAGCHSVSRDGNIIAFSAAGGEGYLIESRTEAPGSPLFAPQYAEVDSSTPALNHDGTLLLNVIGGHLFLYDGSTGSRLSEIGPSLLLGLRPLFPEWAPDGRGVVLTLDSGGGSDYQAHAGAIATMPVQGREFGRAKIIVPAAGNNFYPSWSPDGKWIVYTETDAGELSYDAPNARLMLVSSDGANIYPLKRASFGRTTTWPKFAPFVQLGGDLMFISFNAREPDGTPQLWMGAIDLRLLPDDPSAPPVWLPFQDPGEHNRLGYWTQAIKCGSATVSSCGDGEACIHGACTVL